MGRYILQRLGMALLVVLLAVTINFAIPRAMPGDAVEAQLAQLSAGGGQVGDMREIAGAMRARFGLDQPLWHQYLAWVGGALRFDLGVSVVNYPQPVWEVIRDSLPWTIGLLGTATLIAFALGTLLGGAMAWPGVPGWVKALGLPLLVLSAVPYFILGVVLLAVLGLAWGLFPVAGGFPFGEVPRPDLRSLGLLLWHAALPGLSIVLASLGLWAVAMRGLLVGVLGEDHITLAEAKGLPPRRIFLAYGLRNAMLPQLTQLALKLGQLVSGAILVEVIFAYPGIGYRLYQAIHQKDVFVVQGIVLLLSVSIALAMLLLELLYPLVDPRVATGRAG
ncbi:ABC transporter permease [Roseomonas sp. OT10]|uniref:ABC transporter permease n=1 Tax=Roseomonas cutis TaxID=2897332 RepID=UPI001E63D30E|nr:ABC transporter permease [Roseomonas sp. OT10]UFN48834.1 ABC transporter permease [Roseomonas sp. OT10]